MLHKADTALVELTEAGSHVFTTATAVEAGLSANQVQRRIGGTWRRLHRGVYALPGVPSSWRTDLLAAVCAGGPGAVASHRSAAVVYGVPGQRTDIVEITCPRWHRTRTPGLVVHEQRRLPDHDVTTVDGLAIVTPEMLVIQLAAWKPAPNYVEAVIQALRRNRAITYESMSETFARHARRGLRGVRATRVALDRWNPANAPTESEMETLLVQTLRAHGLPEPVTQFEILDDRGQLVARADAALPQWRITVEYQSNQEHLDEFQVARDDRRRNRVIAAGYFPLCARADDLRRGGDELAAEIRAVMRRQDHRGTSNWRHLRAPQGDK